MSQAAPQVDDSQTIGFIGLGLMGQAMAGRLLKMGHSVRGYDVSTTTLERFAQVGGTAVGSAAEAATGSRLLVVMVHHETQVADVLFAGAAAAALEPGAVVWVATTVSPAFAINLAWQLADVGLRLLDGPVSGGLQRARSGELSIFAGAAEETIIAARAATDACASRVYRLGPTGAGSAMKLINQILTAAHVALTAEALTIGQRAGINPDMMIDAVMHSAGNSRQFELRAPRMVAGDHEITTTVRTFLKDLTIATDAAVDLGVPTPMADAAKQVFKQAGDLGLLDESDTTLFRAYRGNFGSRGGELDR